MTINYFIIKGKSKYCSIYVRFLDSKRIDQKTKTGISVKYNDWSKSKQRLKLKATSKNIDFINNQLNSLEDYLFDKYQLDYNSNNYITKNWLKDSVDSFFNRVEEDELFKVYFTDWIKKFNDEAHKRLHNGKPIKERSILNYKSTYNKLISFEKHQGKKYRFEDIDLNFHRDFIHYCQTIEKLNNNSIGNLISRIKTFCRNIEIEGYPINQLYKHNNFYRPKNETFEIYLTESEIDTIFNHDFSDSEMLDNARDLFIIGLRTGLRVSDFLRITKENIIGNVINITTQKTNQNLTIPIHPQFQKVLDKRNGKFPRKISEQKFNKYIKKVSEKAGINEKSYGTKFNEKSKKRELGLYPKHELVTSHTCRRSFATNLFLAGKFDNNIIMKATGHKSEKQFLTYIKATKDEHVRKLSDYWKQSDLNN